MTEDGFLLFAGDKDAADNAKQAEDGHDAYCFAHE